MFVFLKKHLIFFLFLLTVTGFSQPGEFFINNYSPKDYISGNTNYGIVQNKEGLIFAANASGVMIYDGYNWKVIKVPGEPIVTAITVSKNNEIYIGCDNGDFGIFSQDKKGSFRYFSLRKNLPGNFQTSLPIKYVHTLNNRTYFLSEEILIEYHNGELKTFFPVNKFHIRPIIMDNYIFLEDVEQNLLVFSNGIFKPVLKSEEISKNKFYFTYKIGENEFAIGFRGIGMYKANLDPEHPEMTQFVPLPSAPCTNELLAAEMVNGFPLRNGNFVVTSNKGGAFIIDKNLRIISRLNSKTGVYDENVKSGYEDINGNIWLALNYGISFIELQTPIRKFTRKNGINGVVESSAVHNNVLFIATDKGVFYFDTLEYSFKQLNNFSEQTWEIWNNPKNNHLYISTRKGLYEYDDKKINSIYQSESGSIYCFMNDPLNANNLYCGHDNGVDLINVKEGTLIKTYYINSEVRSIVADENKNIYFSSENNGIYFLNYEKGLTLDSIQKKEGLQSLDENYGFTLNKRF